MRIDGSQHIEMGRLGWEAEIPMNCRLWQDRGPNQSFDGACKRKAISGILQIFAGCRLSLSQTFASPREMSPHSKLAGDENGRLASTTKMANSSRSVVPALNTSIGVSAPCPIIVMPASV